MKTRGINKREDFLLMISLLNINGVIAKFRHIEASQGQSFSWPRGSKYWYIRL